MAATALLVPLVLLSAVLHASWNAVVKAAHVDRLTTQSLVIWTSTVAGALTVPMSLAAKKLEQTLRFET